MNIADDLVKAFNDGYQQGKRDAVVRGEWQWYEEWKESTPDGPAECQSAGYACSVCGIRLSEYLSESLGETIYADNFEETPKIAFCPNCGAKMGGEKDES